MQQLNDEISNITKRSNMIGSMHEITQTSDQEIKEIDHVVILLFLGLSLLIIHVVNQRNSYNKTKKNVCSSEQRKNDHIYLQSR